MLSILILIQKLIKIVLILLQNLIIKLMSILLFMHAKYTSIAIHVKHFLLLKAQEIEKLNGS